MQTGSRRTTGSLVPFNLFSAFAPDVLKPRNPPGRSRVTTGSAGGRSPASEPFFGSSRMRAFSGARTFVLGVSLSATGLAGCQTPDPSPRPAHPVPDLPRGIPPTLKQDTAVPVAPVGSPGAVGPTGVVTQAGGTAPGEFPVAVPGAPLTVADLERLALAHNPTLVQAAAFVDAARGKATQAGLPFNPTVGQTFEQIGAGNTFGEARWFTLQQQIVTGGKLRLSRLKYQKEAELAEIQASAQRLRVVNGITSAYFGVLAAQRTVENERRLLENAEAAVKTTEQLVNVGQGNQQDLLQAQVDASQARVALRTAEARLRQDWTHLVTIVGVPDLPQQPLVGSLEPDGPPLTWDEALARLYQESPELLFAVAKVSQDEIIVERERREPIPNVTVRGGVGYNFETRNNTADAAFTLPLPLFDRNQGTVRQALADLGRSRAEVTRVQLDLRRRLADAFTRYQTARDQVENFRTEALPKARKASELYEEQFKNRRAAFPQVLVAQRTVFQLNEDYNRSLLEFRRAEVEVRGLLLVDGLTAPREPVPPGHINATPKPR
ncbi:MAG: transporter [Isosphaera sp.]|nr:transporter [Isosphaera sp.]